MAELGVTLGPSLVSPRPLCVLFHLTPVLPHNTSTTLTMMKREHNSSLSHHFELPGVLARGRGGSSVTKQSGPRFGPSTSSPPFSLPPLLTSCMFYASLPVLGYLHQP